MNENTTGLQLCRTGQPRETLQDTIRTLQVVSFLGFLPFLPKNASGMHFAHLYAPCDITTTKMMPPSGRAYPHAYTVQA